MYGWIVDGISSLFEPVSGQNPSEWPKRGDVSEAIPTLSDARVQRRQNHGRPVKRSYQSVDFADSVCQSDQVEVKRRRKDVVISFVKKTVACVAGLLRLRKPLTTSCKKHRQYEEPQPITLGIDELHTSWLKSTEWGMDKPLGGMNERSGKSHFQSSSPPLMRKFSGTVLPTGLPDRGKEKERRGSLQLLPSRPAVRVPNPNMDQIFGGLGHNRCYKQSLTVEEAIKQNNREHYRRLLEMVTDKYSKSQPLPFNQTKPKDLSLLQTEHKATASVKAFESVAKKTGYPAVPTVFTWKNASTPKDRFGTLTGSKTFNGGSEDTHSRCAKNPAAELDLSTQVATRLSIGEPETPTVSFPDTYSVHSAHIRHADEDIPRLTRDMAIEVSGALAQSDPNLVLSAAFKLRITQRDLATLMDGGWLNDEVMNFYLSLVMERSSDQASCLKVYTFSTFFYPKLRGGVSGQAGGQSAVHRWTKSVDLFLYDLILVPLHLGIHWAMAIIDFKSKTVTSYDSMGQRHDEICSLLLHYLKDEHRVKKGREFDSAKWTFGSKRASEIPQQRNGSDCGVFACKYAEYVTKGRPLTFKQCHMPLFRKLMIWEILNRKLL